MILTKEKGKRMWGNLFSGGNTNGGSGGSGGSGGGGGSTEWAANAGHADEADHATAADLADEAKALTSDSTDWLKIARKDIAQTIAEAWTFANGFTSTLKAYFSAGIEVTGDTKTGTLTTTGDATVGGNMSASGNVSSSGNVSAYNNVSGNSMTATTSMTAATMIANVFKTVGFTEAVNMIGNGFGVKLDANGLATLQTDNLLVLGQMIVQSLTIREVSYIGGSYMLTPAASQAVMVQPLYTTISYKPDTRYWTPNGSGDVVGYRLLWLADNGSVGTMNYWKQGDIALCQTFNVTAPGNYTNVQNQYYKRVVCRVGQTNITEGGETKTYHYADLANIAGPRLFDANDNPIPNVDGSYEFNGYLTGATVPKAGDKVVACGSQADTNRQGCVLISAEGEASIAIYDGIKDYQSLSVYEIHYLSKTVVRMRADKFYWRSSGGTLMHTQEGFEIAIGNCGIDIDNEIIKLKANKVNFYDASGTNLNPKIWIDPASGALNAVDGNFSGTVKANNLFRAIALTAGEVNGGDLGYTPVFESTNTSKKWIGFFNNTTAGGMIFRAGEYYRLSDLPALVQQVLLDSGDPSFDCWDFCTGPADEVMVVDDHFTPRSSSPYVILPRCQDYVGKMVTIRHERNQVNYTARIVQIDYFKGPSAAVAHFVESIGIDASGDLYLDTSHAQAWTDVNHGSTITLYSVGTYWVVIDEK